MIISHVFTLLVLYCSVATKFHMPEDEWATTERLVLVITIMQLPFWVYLIHVVSSEDALVCTSLGH